MSSVAKISLVWSLIIASASVVYARETYAITDIISDIYEQLTETSEVDYEQLQDELLSFADHPIDLNTATAHDLEQLRFLSTRQVDAILRYVDQHPMHNVGELDLISELQPYDIYGLLPFWCRRWYRRLPSTRPSTIRCCLCFSYTTSQTISLY